MQSKFACCVHVRQILESIEVILFLVWHFREKTSPDPLVKLRISQTPSDAAEGLAVIFNIVHYKAIASSAWISDQGASHSWSKASQTTVFSFKGILSGIVVHRIQLEAARQCWARDFFRR